LRPVWCSLSRSSCCSSAPEGATRSRRKSRGRSEEEAGEFLRRRGSCPRSGSFRRLGVRLVARAGYGLGEFQRFAVLVPVDRREHPVGLGELVDDGGEQIVGDRPVRRLAVQFAGRRAVPRKVLEQYREPPRRQQPPVPVQQVDPVVAEQVRLQGLGVLFDQLAEAQSSPRPSPVSLP